MQAQALRQVAFAIAYRLTNNIHLAEEAAQEAMLRLLRQPKAPRKPEAWVKTVASNYLRDLVSSAAHRKRKDVQLDEIPVEERDHLVEQETREMVRDTIKLLDKQDRLLLYDAYLKELSTAELMMKYGLKVRSTLYMRLVRARRNFKDKFVAAGM